MILVPYVLTMMLEEHEFIFDQHRSNYLFDTGGYARQGKGGNDGRICAVRTCVEIFVATHLETLPFQNVGFSRVQGDLVSAVT